MNGEPTSKGSKTENIGQVSDNDANQNDVQMTVAVPAPSAAQGKRCEIFKLDVDCCEELFDWLSIADLHSIGQTCKRMNRIAGMYFRQNCSRVRPTTRHDGIYYGSARINGFSEFVEEISIPEGITTNLLECIAANCKSLKRIVLWLSHPIVANEFHLIRDVLAKIEDIEIRGNYPNESILALCPNLTHFTCGWDKAESLFALDKCPKLEYISLSIFGLFREQIVDVNAFFNQIPNIRTLVVYLNFLLINKDQFVNSDVKLDNLVIHFFVTDPLVYNTLTELHEHGFYKRLHFFQMGFTEQQEINQMASLRALETLCLYGISENEKIVWPVMENVKNFDMQSWDNIDLNTLASKLPNLRRIRLNDNYLELILPFMRGSKQLSSIIMRYKYERPTENILDLSALNKERQKLNGACKVVIRVPEELYLNTKFAFGTSRSLVEIKRNESIKTENWFLE